MPCLLASAEEREKNNNVLYMRKLHKELKEDRESYGEETEKFLTSAYKKQLEENRKYEEKERQLEALEKNNDITKKGQTAFSDFHRNLLEQRNIAMGGQSDSNLTIPPHLLKKRTATTLTPEEEEELELRERDRRKRNRERAEQAAKEAHEIQKSREEAKQMKINELQQQYAQHVTTEEAKNEALQRYIERQKMRKIEQQTAVQNQAPEEQ